jgi:tetratricopeptide (TPR) repeat protein
MVQAPESEKGQGNLSFHYANKSTDANLAIDLSSTDVYLEMTGKAAQEQIEQLRAVPPERKSAPPARRPQAPAPETKASEEASDASSAETADAEGAGEAPSAEPRAGKAPNPEHPRPGKGLHKAPPRKPDPEPEEEPAEYEDVTAKVLSGIRRAQELFYQKRYPEAMQAVRSSQDARATAEGYALQGSIHFMQGQIGMARRQWMEALRLNPDMPAVVNMLERTRTPGGRGSPSPRPVYRPPARAAEPEVSDPEAPYPEEASVPAPAPPVSAASRAMPAAAAGPAAPPAEPAATAPEEDAQAAPSQPAVAPKPIPAPAPAKDGKK